MDALKLVYDYLLNKKQRVKTNEACSSWKDVEYDIPKGSILGLLLFNIHFGDLFYFIEDLKISSYVVDTTIYTVKRNKESVINTSERSSLLLFKCSTSVFCES